jgi:hypothetical protein
MIKWITEFIRKANDYDAMKEAFKARIEERDNRVAYTEAYFTEQLREVVDQLDKARRTKEILEEQIADMIKKETTDIMELRDWYEGRRSVLPWIYNGRRLGSVDVKYYLIPSDVKPFTELAEDLIKRYKLDKKSKPEDIMTMMYRYWNLRSSWTYVSDLAQFGQIEWWEDATEALKRRRGDCESKTKCMYWTAMEMLRLLDKEEHQWRVTFIAASVIGEGGHAFLTWLHDDGEYYVIESTYDEVNSKGKTWLKTPMRFNNLYGTPWGFATHKQSWRGSNQALLSFRDIGDF